MSIKSNSLLAIAALVLLNVLVTAEATSTRYVKGANVNNLVYLGTADGKSYLAERVAKTWADAKQTCNESDMHLATVTSQAQVTFLRNAYNNVTFNGNHWLAARDAMDLSQFSWDHTGEKLNGSLISLISVPKLENCLTYYSYTAPNGFYSVPCSRLYYTLCEIVHGEEE